MDALIQNLQYESDTIKALVVSAGGLIGVFATLGIFFIVMLVSNKIGERSPKKGED
jgi:hypothetical protein